MPGQSVRKKSVRQKLNAISSEFKGRNVLLVDDSIVRGTTSKEIVQMARDAGARKVYLASAAPPVRYPNVYGIDMPTSSELVAHKRTVAQISELIGCDALIYQDVEAMKKAIGALNPRISGFDASCFDGIYVTGDINAEDIDRINADVYKRQVLMTAPRHRPCSKAKSQVKKCKNLLPQGALWCRSALFPIQPKPTRFASSWSVPA